MLKQKNDKKFLSYFRQMTEIFQGKESERGKGNVITTFIHIPQTNSVSGTVFRFPYISIQQLIVVCTASSLD